MRQRKWPVQRPRGRSVPGVLEEQCGGPCSWSRVSEPESVRLPILDVGWESKSKFKDCPMY